MARIPGTETPVNHDGWRPGDLVRGRRSRAAAALGLAERPGIVTEVRFGHVRVLFDPGQAALWITNETVVGGDEPGPAALATVRQLLRALGAVRLETEASDSGDQLTFYCGEVGWEALQEARTLMGTRLASLEVAPEGAHELAVKLHLTPGR